MTKPSEPYSAIAPLSVLFGNGKSEKEDPYDRRKVKQLDDISFGDSEDEITEIEDI